MGLTKQYLRYKETGRFNGITSGTCNVCFVVYKGQEGRYLAVGVSEDVIIWDLRLGEKAVTINGEEHHEVTFLAASPDKTHLAIGLSDGQINVANLVNDEIKTVFSGHRKAISYLAFDGNGHRLASGGKDTEIITWDIISETGIERLSGHKGIITSLCFMKNKNIIVSSSKDTFIKFWDLDTNHCFHTIAAHVTEVWGITIVGNDEFVVAGSNDSELSVWNLEENDLDHITENKSELNITKAGSMLREGRGRLCSMGVDGTGRLLAVHGNDSLVEIFQFFDQTEAAARANKRCIKERKKAAKTGNEYQILEMCLKDKVKKLTTYKCSNKVKGISCARGHKELRVAASLSNNKIELYSISLENQKQSKAKIEGKFLRRVMNPGHQGEVRAVAFSSDNLAIASAGSDSIKIWNRVSLQCLRTVSVDYALCACFVPGDRHAVVGLKNGHLLVVDLSVGEILEDIEAHSGEIWAVVKTHDLTGVITCSGDTTVKIWKFELITIKETQSKVLSVEHTRTLKLDEAVLSVKVTPCGKLIAAALIDSTAKLFFYDSFKFFVSLYGHKLPVLCLDICSDSTLIVTGSADRSVKIWGLDFGDCHKSLFAHEESVTAVQFVPGTHYFFSAGKDGKVNQWDADSFNKIISLDGHFGECWNLSVCENFVISCGKDRVLRFYEKTDEPLVLSDEMEEEREKEELATGSDSIVKLPSTKTLTAEKGAESLMECLEIIQLYKKELGNGEMPDIPIQMKAYGCTNVEDYLAKSLLAIRPSDLGESLIILPFHLVSFMLTVLPDLLLNPNLIEIACKAIMLLLRVHQAPLVADTTQVSVIEKIQELAVRSVKEYRDLVGVNLHGLMYVQRTIEDSEGTQFFREATSEQKLKNKKKRNREKITKAVYTLTI